MYSAVIFAFALLASTAVHVSGQLMICKPVETDSNDQVVSNSILQAKIDQLEQTIEELKTKQCSNEDNLVCDEGFPYEEKCYFIPQRNGITSREDAEKLCTDNGGELGDILNAEHQKMFEDYTRENVPFSSTTMIWLGNLYQSSTETLLLTDGSQIPSSSLQWKSGYPKSYSNMADYIWLDESSPYGGMTTFQSGSMNNALCMK